MEIIELPVEDEWPHTPGPEPLWQESVVLTWQDVTQSIGGFFRIGQHPNRGVGICTFGVVSKNGICFNGSRIGAALRDGDRAGNRFALDGFVSAAFDRRAQAAGRRMMRIATSICTSPIFTRNTTPGRCQACATASVTNSRRAIPKSRGWLPAMCAWATGAGSSTGSRSATIPGACATTATPAAALANFCWLVGSFGTDLVISLSEVISRAGKRFTTGFVIHEGEIGRPVLRDVSFQVELDGLSLRGARASVETAEFGTFDLDIEGFGNVLMAMQAEHGQEGSYLEFGMPGVMRCNGMTGGVHLSTMFNARGARNPPVMLFGASNERGLYRAPRWTPSGGGG